MKIKKIKQNVIFSKFLFLFIYCSVQGQSLHHQMISCQVGINNEVRFTVGQQSVIGTTVNGVVVQQGFQQSNWNKIIEQNSISIQMTTYPNPFTDIVNFSFSNSPGTEISLTVFDLLGRPVYSDVLKNEGNLISVNLNKLSTAEYLVKLTSNNFIYSIKLIKR